MIPRIFALSLLAASLFSLGAQTALPTLSSKLDRLRYFEGDWACSGTFAKTGKPIEADMLFERILDGAWIGFRHDDKMPNRYHSFALWGWDRKQNSYVSTAVDNFGGERKFVSSGFQEDQIAWTNASDHERFRFTKQAAKRFRMVYERQTQQNWDVVDSLTCIAAEFSRNATE